MEVPHYVPEATMEDGLTEGTWNFPLVVRDGQSGKYIGLYGGAEFAGPVFANNQIFGLEQGFDGRPPTYDPYDPDSERRVKYLINYAPEGSSKAVCALAGLYGMPVFHYEDLYIGLLWKIYCDPASHALDNGKIKCELVYSNDGKHFNRTFRRPFIDNPELEVHSGETFAIRGDFSKLDCLWDADEPGEAEQFSRPGMFQGLELQPCAA